MSLAKQIKANLGTELAELLSELKHLRAERKKGHASKVVYMIDTTTQIGGKAKKIDNIYANTNCAKITSSNSDDTLKICGVEKGTTTLKVRVNGVKTLKLKVKVI